MKLKTLSSMISLALLFGCHIEEEPNIGTAKPSVSAPSVEQTPPIKPIEIDSQDFVVEKLLEISLTNVKGTPIKTLSVDVNTITQNEKPSTVDLNNIKILNGIITNETPYEISHLYVMLDGVPVNVVFSTVIPPYSQGNVSSKLNTAKVINVTTISNTTFKYTENPNSAGRPNSRHANAEERNTSEYVQIYDRYMMNAPASLNQITQQLVNICTVNGLCNNYSGSPENYAIDTYFSKSVSGLNSNFWINPDVWGLANAPGLENTRSNISSNQTIWMSPVLMNYVNLNDYIKEQEGWQALVHEFYHNFGFAHESGWPSNSGIDDIFGKATVDDYLINNRNKYITSDVVFDKAIIINNRTFKFDIFTNEQNAGNLNLRLLSTRPTEVNITQNGSNEVIISFKNTPESDVYVSFYSESSKQMATAPLSLVKKIDTNNELSKFNQNIENYLAMHANINVNISDGHWAERFILPSVGVNEGSTVYFGSQASFKATIVHDGVETPISRGNYFKFIFDGTKWQNGTTNTLSDSSPHQ